MSQQWWVNFEIVVIARFWFVKVIGEPGSYPSRHLDYKRNQFFNLSNEYRTQIAIGMISQKNYVYFRALPKLALPPPPNSGNLVLFFPTSKTTYSAYDGKSTDDDDDGWNDNYDGDDDSIDEIDDKNDHNTHKYYDF